MKVVMQRFLGMTAAIGGLLVIVVYGWLSLQHDGIVEPLEISQVVAPITTSAPVTDVEIRNRGRIAVEVVQLTTNCGCSVPEVNLPIRLSPGQRANVPVRGNPPAYGVKSVELAIHTSDSRQPIVRVPLTLRGDELSPPYIIPRGSELHWHVLGHHDAVLNKIRIETIESVSTEPWLQNVRCSVPGAEIDPIKIVETRNWTPTAEQRTYEMDFRFPQTQSPRPAIISGELLFDVISSPSRPLPTFRFVLESREMLAVRPEALLLYADSTSDTGTIERTIHVWRRDGERPKSLRAVSTAEWLQIKHVPAETQDVSLAYLVRIDIPSADASGDSSANIRFEDESGATVSLPVRFQPR